MEITSSHHQQQSISMKTRKLSVSRSVGVAKDKGQPFVTGSYPPDHKQTGVVQSLWNMVSTWKNYPTMHMAQFSLMWVISGRAHTNS